MVDQEWRARSVQILTEIGTGPTWSAYDLSNNCDWSLLRKDISKALYGDIAVDSFDQESAEEIARICSNQNCELGLEVLHLAVVYLCVKIMTTGADYVIPVFRVRNNSNDPGTCGIIDHLGFYYQDFDTYRDNNTWPNCWLVVPTNLQYKLDNGECNTELITINTSRVLNFTTPTGPTGEMILDSLRSQREDEINEIRLLKNSLHQMYHKTFDASRRAFHEIVQPGSVLPSHGDRRFIRDMKRHQNIDRLFENFTLTENGKLIVNGRMTIHPRSFFQMPDNVKKAIMEGTREMNENRDMTKETAIKRFRSKFEGSDPKKLYRHMYLDEEWIDDEQRLLDSSKFNVQSLADVNIAGIHIFAELKPYEIRRLYKLVRDWSPESIAFAKNFAARMCVQNFVDFCAAAEYSRRVVDREFHLRRKGLRGSSLKTKKEREKSLKNEIINELNRNLNHKLTDILNSLQKLMTDCNRAYNSEGPKFVSAIVAANHVDKHGKEFTKDTSQASDTYLGLAHRQTSSNYSEVQWMQDGTRLCCTYISKENSTRAVKIVRYPLSSEKTGVIATLMTEKNIRDVVGNYYYYHPHY